jgi:hypothetical protein
MIRFDPESLRRSASGSITGILHFSFGDNHFPGLGWSDFVLVILGWWIAALRSNDRNILLEFMDGPYRLRVTRSDDAATLDCIESRQQDVVSFSTRVRFLDLRKQVEEVAQKATAACRTQNWDSDDLRALARSLRHD